MITGTQIRAAMAIVGWSTAKLSQESGVGTTTITQLKKVDGIKGNTEFNTLESIRSALSRALKTKGMTLTNSGVEAVKSSTLSAEQIPMRNHREYMNDLTTEMHKKMSKDGD